jgi:hypothetical protein
MKSEAIDFSSSKWFKIVFWVCYHEMTIKMCMRYFFSERGDNGWPKGKIGDKVAKVMIRLPIHDIDVEGVNSIVENGFTL